MGKKKKKKKKKQQKQQAQQIISYADVELKPKKYAYLVGDVPVEPGAIEQMERAMSLPVSVAGALMPDAHQGYGLPIGGVLATDNVVIPYAVGMDIGCRMALSIFETEPDFLEKNRQWLKTVLIQNTRFGTDEFEDRPWDPVLDREEFMEIPFLKKLHKTAIRQFGTSGRGNHFVEFGIVHITMPNNPLNLKPGYYFGILSHSGSRHFGYEIAKHYSALAQQLRNLPPKIAKLAWLELDSAEGQEYWKAMNLAGDYAKANHNYIHSLLAKKLNMKPVAKVENHHNFAWIENINGRDLVVHRKGATPAHAGDLGIIPGNMVLPAYIVRGKGNPLSLYSASHGAGRLMSRNQAKRIFTRQMLDKVLNEYGVELIGGGLDEAPMAYKNIHDVIKAQSDLIDVIGTFQPKIVRME